MFILMASFLFLCRKKHLFLQTLLYYFSVHSVTIAEQKIFIKKLLCPASNAPQVIYVLEKRKKYTMQEWLSNRILIGL